MVNKNMEAYKITREIKRSGKEYAFERDYVGEFGQPIGETITIATIPCLYHEQSSAVRITTGETTQIRTKKIPSLLALFTDVSTTKLSVGDYTMINGKRYEVTGCVNVQLWDIIADISLEVFDNVVLPEL